MPIIGKFMSLYVNLRKITEIYGNLTMIGVNYQHCTSIIIRESYGIRIWYPKLEQKHFILMRTLKMNETIEKINCLNYLIRFNRLTSKNLSISNQESQTTR